MNFEASRRGPNGLIMDSDWKYNGEVSHKSGNVMDKAKVWPEFQYSEMCFSDRIIIELSEVGVSIEPVVGCFLTTTIMFLLYVLVTVLWFLCYFSVLLLYLLICIFCSNDGVTSLRLTLLCPSPTWFCSYPAQLCLLLLDSAAARLISSILACQSLDLEGDGGRGWSEGTGQWGKWKEAERWVVAVAHLEKDRGKRESWRGRGADAEAERRLWRMREAWEDGGASGSWYIGRGGAWAAWWLAQPTSYSFFVCFFLFFPLHADVLHFLTLVWCRLASRLTRQSGNAVLSRHASLYRLDSHVSKYTHIFTCMLLCSFENYLDRCMQGWRHIYFL